MLVFEKVKETLVQYLDIDPTTITEGSSIKADLGADAIDVEDILMDLESAYELHIPERKIGLQVGAIVNFIEGKQPQQTEQTEQEVQEVRLEEKKSA